MNREKILWVAFDTNRYYNLMVKLNEVGITIYDNKRSNNKVLIKTNYKDYKKIKKYLVSYKVEIDSYDGIYKKIKYMKKYIFFLVSFIIGICFLFLLNNMVFKIVVNSPSKNIQSLVKNELNKNGIKELTLKKRHKKIEIIVDKILDDNKDTLEWLEIKYDGLILIVNVTEKTNKNIEEEYPYCNIVASMDALITGMNIFRGVPLKDINDYVSKGDVILSGNLTHNEEEVKKICASGEVYGEVWYKVSVTLPLVEEYILYTGKNRYNFEVLLNDNSYKILKSRVKNGLLKKTNLYKLNDFEINLVKEQEYVTKYKTLEENEGYNKALSKALEKIKQTFSTNEEIITQKVLKKSLIDSTIYLEVFVVAKKNIGVLQEVEEEVVDDTKHDNESNE